MSSWRSTKIVQHFSERPRFTDDWGFQILGLGYQPTVHKISFPKMKKWALPCFSINWIVSGGGWFESVATGKMAVKSGDAVLRFPYEPVRYGPEEGGEWSDFWMLFEGAQIEKLHKRTWIQPEHPVIQYPVTSKSLALWRQWIHWGSQRPPLLDRMAVQFQSWWLEGILAQSKHFSSREPVSPSEIFRRRLTALAGREHLDIKALAAELKIPYHSLRRDFKKMTGFAPTEYWIELKVREARQRLASTDESVGRIGERVGFEDAYYFSRVFKKRTGMSPMEYRIFFRGKN